MNYFDGHYETVRLENGRSFGIAPHTYQKLAQAAISAFECADIEPILLTPLEDGSAGAVCTLYGKHYAFWIRLEGDPMTVSLSMSPLDGNTLPDLIVQGAADDFEIWRSVVHNMLKAEDVPFWTWEQVQEWNREHGFT